MESFLKDEEEGIEKVSDDNLACAQLCEKWLLWEK